MVQFIRRKEADTTERLNKGKKNKEELPGEGKDRSLPRSYDFHAWLATTAPACSRKVRVKVARSCAALCNPMDYTAHGILQARVLEWVAFPFSRGSSQPRD